MTTQNATFTFALPDDQNSDKLEIYAASTKDGSYSLVTQADYTYGTTQYLYAALDDTLWYRIRFLNSTDATRGPFSDVVFGGTYSEAAPFLVVSTTTDGANYATTQDVYDYSNLTAADISQSQVSTALRSARSIIDFKTAQMNLTRFNVFTEDVARRKYNAVLRIVKEAEINIALSNIYLNLSDDLIIESKREGGLGTGSLTVGSTTIDNDGLAERSENIVYLSTLAARYRTVGYQLLATVDTNSVYLVSADPNELIFTPRFKLPNPGYYSVGSGYSGYF